MKRYRIPVQPWMEAPALGMVMHALTADGADARLVGGCVRDALVGRPIKDIDIATPDPPDRVIEKLESAGVRSIPTGMAHGTITAVVDGQPFEVTTLRDDVETDGRHAVVRFTTDWLHDAKRRDLTFNAMSMSLDGMVHDPFGGFEDVFRGRVRFIGDASARVAEDYLRILRFFRFFAHYGQPPADPEALRACRDGADGLRRISVERISRELLRLLKGNDPVTALGLMEETAVLPEVLPEVTFARTSAVLKSLVTLEGVTVGCDPARRLAILIDDTAERAEAIGRRLRLSNEMIARLEAIAPRLPEIDPDDGAPALRRLRYRHGAEWLRDRALRCWAVEVAAGNPPDRWRYEAWRDLLGNAMRWTVPEFPIGGADVLATGLPPGPEVGEMLRALEAWWIDRNFTPDRAACLAELERRLQENRSR